MNHSKALYISWTICLCLIAAVSMQQGCNQATDVANKEEIAPLIGRGSGGPATLIGSITAPKNPTGAGVKVELLKSDDYATKAAELLMDSLPRTFKITELPLGRVDLFIEAPGFFSIKKAGIQLAVGETVLGEPFGFTRAVADSDLIIPGEVLVEFKAGVSREQMLQAIADANYTVKRADTPVTGTGRFFVLNIPDDKTVWEMVAFFNVLSIIEYAVPSRVIPVDG